MQEKEIIAHLESFLTPHRRSLFKEVLAQRTNHLTIATQDVYQLHNTSAVMRSCEVFGIQNLHVIEERKPKNIQREIAMGSQKWTTINSYKSSEDCLASLRNKGYQIVATTPGTASTALSDFAIEKPSAIFFGTEKEGLSDNIISEADVQLKIPMFGFTESLNISVAAAIIIQSLTSRLRNSKIDWKLDEKEAKSIYFNWLQKSVKNSESIIAQYKQ
ncbi:tRNA (guanosine-2'-O-)-methyltransferase [Salegentibacter echinorum]|uniref:tRNA (guanosine(18)-2'-O)-methyltransferase n=1 Tax=Salegentibacter echinorum TaxID=1073325 RepID=A0A1M5CY57_SALEC|nr:RNA methyltransferase [Salegentibacter echinorum]SHF59584.1 tRNA (guanosine-2'-O-)-methyltransferase [Salegentibacter echinorum]